MNISETWTYDAPADRVWAMMTDPAFQERKCSESGALSHDVSITEDGDAATIVVTRQMPTDDLPSQVRSFLSKGLVVEETQRWQAPNPNGSREGTVTVLIKGTPATMKGTVSLTAQDARTALALDADLKAGVPLVGGQIEKAAAPALVTGIRVEAEVGQTYLAG